MISLCLVRLAMRLSVIRVCVVALHGCAAVVKLVRRVRMCGPRCGHLPRGPDREVLGRLCPWRARARQDAALRSRLGGTSARSRPRAHATPTRAERETRIGETQGSACAAPKTTNKGGGAGRSLTLFSVWGKKQDPDPELTVTVVVAKTASNAPH